MKEIRIRHRHESDVDGCVRALGAVYRVDGYPTNWPSDPKEWLMPAGILQGWVAVADEATVVGHVLLRTAGEPGTRAASVSRLFVAPDARGRGLGARLLEQASRWAIVRGLRLELEVTDSKRSAAMALYERTGWQRIETVQADWTTPDGDAVTLHRYVLQNHPQGESPSGRH